jgi:hypothetical protein
MNALSVNAGYKNCNEKHSKLTYVCVCVCETEWRQSVYRRQVLQNVDTIIILTSADTSAPNKTYFNLQLTNHNNNNNNTSSSIGYSTLIKTVKHNHAKFNTNTWLQLQLIIL